MTMRIYKNFDGDWTFPLSETYHAFGDGSETETGVFFGLVLIPVSKAVVAENLLKTIKKRYGGGDYSTIHGRTLFPNHQRQKTEWKGLTAQQCGSMVSDVFRELDSLRPLYMITHWPIQNFPKRFRLKSKDSNPDVTHPVDAKWMILWSYFHTACYLDAALIVAPPDPTLIPTPHNLPSWRMIIQRSDPGPRVSKIYLDRETTRIHWFSRSFQWTTVAREMVIETPRGKTVLPIEQHNTNKHPLIEIADIFVYSLSRQMSGRDALPIEAPKSPVLMDIRQKLGEELVLGG